MSAPGLAVTIIELSLPANWSCLPQSLPSHLSCHIGLIPEKGRVISECDPYRSSITKYQYLRSTLQPKPDPRISGKQFPELLKSAQSSSNFSGSKKIHARYNARMWRSHAWSFGGRTVPFRFSPHIKLKRWPQRHTRRPSSAKLKTPLARKKNSTEDE